MKNMIKPLIAAKNPQNDFLKRLLGNHLEILTVDSHNISSGIKLNIFNVVFSSIDQEPEEKTFLSFFPIEDDKEYLQISFFPEYNLKEEYNHYQITQLVFSPEFFAQWPESTLNKTQPFRFDRSVEQALNLPACSNGPVLSLVENASSKDFLQLMRQHEIALFLLRLTLEAFTHPDEACKLPACSFLNNSSERQKVLEAHSVIMSRLENPITIRELAREVGINECYLKKGFKAMYGKTIHGLQQFERIEKAKELLKLNKYSINEVAYKMGFGSPSHFSTSFKKIAGMKPCELLA